jgi:hypothetical protein
VARRNSCSRVLRELARELLNDPLFDLEFAGERQVYQDMAKTPMGEPNNHSSVETGHRNVGELP